MTFTSDDSTQWYYGSGNDRRGPYTRAQLLPLIEAGAVDGQTLVWAEGMGDWQPLSRTPLAQGLSAQQLAPRPNAMGSMGYGGGFGDAGGMGAAPPMGFGEAIKSCFSKYVTFSGRASRSEFWFWMLFYLLGSIVTMVFDGMILGMSDGQAFSPTNAIFSLAIFLPTLSVTVRRLHDTDRSGWWWWLQLIPIVGIIVLIVFYCQRGVPGRNRFG